ncbi:hypothetical protein [Polaromonas sp. UBA4122]|uniref:hypothetical protein n=1 Tax=Polaromonas sp. UBA4122 TaxID=1947074 RepID=UPI0025E430E2|nr:hypothetical protein [Polaromonas sp. UBA4122]
MEVLERRQGDHPTHVFTYEGNPIVQVNTKAWRNALQRAGIEDFRWHEPRLPLKTPEYWRAGGFQGVQGHLV